MVGEPIEANFSLQTCFSVLIFLQTMTRNQQVVSKNIYTQNKYLTQIAEYLLLHPATVDILVLSQMENCIYDAFFLFLCSCHKEAMAGKIRHFFHKIRFIPQAHGQFWAKLYSNGLKMTTMIITYSCILHFLDTIEDLREECYGFALTVFEKNVSITCCFFHVEIQITVSDQVVNLTSKYI